MLRYVLAFFVACAIWLGVIIAVARPDYDISEEVRLAVEWLKPEQVLNVCGYEVSSKLSLVGYEPKNIAKKIQCDSLDDFDHCLLQCLEGGGAPKVAVGCYHVCGPSGGLSVTVSE